MIIGVRIWNLYFVFVLFKIVKPIILLSRWRGCSTHLVNLNNKKVFLVNWKFPSLTYKVNRIKWARAFKNNQTKCVRFPRNLGRRGNSSQYAPVSRCYLDVCSSAKTAVPVVEMSNRTRITTWIILNPKRHTSSFRIKFTFVFHSEAGSVLFNS